ncbi:hypothetical protein, partial [Rhizobium sp.]|uniref:hypothetical protein n=1 Tax=Rhizobium sp. TaxID=391 RepID=UPI0028A684A0
TAVCAKAFPDVQRSVQASSMVAAFRDVGRRVAAPFTFIPLHPANLADAGSKVRQALLQAIERQAGEMMWTNRRSGRRRKF